jgi:hypothetical protein
MLVPFWPVWTQLKKPEFTDCDVPGTVRIRTQYYYLKPIGEKVSGLFKSAQ